MTPGITDELRVLLREIEGTLVRDGSDAAEHRYRAVQAAHELLDRADGRKSRPVEATER